MTGEERRNKIVQIMTNDNEPLSGTKLAKRMQVSRQVIVQDIALLRANGMDIISTNRGYMIGQKGDVKRVFKMIHGDDEVETELNAIVDMGGRVEDVFVYHKVYGVVRAEINVKSRRDVKQYLDYIKSGKSGLLKNVTSGYHYHTVYAEDNDTLDLIQQRLQELGFLAKLQDYEPVDFWKEE